MLLEIMRQKAEQQPYWFIDFMQDALYTPNLGYYRNDRTKFGQNGDFITAPSLSSLFGQTLSKEIENLFSQLSQKNILEFGAGAGHLACDLLNAIGALVEQYYILEISPQLIEQQQATLERLCPLWKHKVSWLKELPNHFIGIMLANEVLDAMPVHRFKISETHRVEAMSVIYDEAAHQWHPKWLPAPEEVEQAVRNIESDLEHALSPGYESEYCPWLAPWIQSLATSLQEGAILLIDYGFPRRDYYHAARNEGTLMCHTQHHSHPDPFWKIGEQDITAHVDFTAVALAASNAGLKVCGYSNQAAFLMSLGITDLPIEAPSQKQALNILLSPAEMGELFKVILVGTQHFSTQGFRLQDDRVRL